MDIQSSFDFSKFESLKAMARQTPGQAADGIQQADGAAFDGQKKALKKAAEQFEALFLQEMLKSMRATVGDDELVDSAAIQTYQEMPSVVNSEAAMLALTAQEGDVAIRTDVSRTFILAAAPASTLANWKELLAPTDAVTSVNGDQGVVVLDANDVGALPAGGGTLTGDLDLNDNELVRANIQDYSEAVGVVASATGTVALDFETGNVWDITLTGDVTTLNLNNPPTSGRAGSLTLIIRQDSTARTIAWPASVEWSGGTAPDISTVSKVYVVTLFTVNAGTRWYGVLGMTGMTA